MCDIGANDGYISDAIFEEFNFKELYMFEPFVNCKIELKNN